MTDPTPGQIAYEAWHAIVIPAMVPGYTEDWSQISAIEQRAWDAAAQAVLEHATVQAVAEAAVQAVLAHEHPQAPRIPTCRWCGQPVAVHPQEGEPWRCRLSDGPLLPKETS